MRSIKHQSSSLTEASNSKHHKQNRNCRDRSRIWSLEFAISLVLGCWCLELAAAAPLPREEWGASAVTVKEDDGKWIIAGKRQVVTLDRKTFALDVQAGAMRWAMASSATNDLIVK